ESRAGITSEPFKLEVHKELTRLVHPLALGNVQRVYQQIRKLARNLLSLHLDEQSNSQRIDSIITALTETFYSHLHAISRKEAISLLGDWVRPPTNEEGSAIWALFDSYSRDLELRSKFNVPALMGD